MAKILIVDDDADVTRTVEAMLFGTGHEVTCENKSKRVENILSETVFDLVISDIFMPEYDGIELVLDIKKASPGVRILIMTGGGRFFPPGSDALAEITDSARMFGASAVITKPFKRQQLLDAVSALID